MQNIMGYGKCKIIGKPRTILYALNTLETRVIRHYILIFILIVDSIAFGLFVVSGLSYFKISSRSMFICIYISSKERKKSLSRSRM